MSLTEILKEVKLQSKTPNLDKLDEAGLSAIEIARSEGISKQAVHKILKSAAGKMYKAVETSMESESPFLALLVLAQMLDLESIDDFKELKKMLPKDILIKVEKDAVNYMRK